MNPPQDLPSWIAPELYCKVYELQELCHHMQYPGTIMCDSKSANLLLDLKQSYTKKFFVTIPMTATTSWEQYYKEISARFRTTTDQHTYNRIYALAYGYHLGALILKKPRHVKSIKAHRLRSFRRTYRLFHAVG
ncbi:8385_t:CDS:2, partial [Ambispora leptoticha]